MIVTDSFVMLNLPKTGSSFARAVIKAIYANQKPTLWQRLRNSSPFIQEIMLPELNQHGGYSQIPCEYRDREIVSIVRNPYERLVSGFEFRHWVDYPMLPADELHERFPHFPNLSLADYLQLLKLSTPDFGFEIGEQTLQFIRMFGRDPKVMEAKLCESYLESDEVLDDIAQVTFLRQEHLRNDLAMFLARKGFSSAEVDQVFQHEKVNVTPNRRASTTPEVVKHVQRRERLVFHVLRSHGVDYCEYAMPALST